MTSKGAVLITGASTGIGAETARYLHEKGYLVYAGVRKEADGKRLQEQFSADIRPVIIDVTNQTQIDQAAEQLQDELGDKGLLGLVNNAGIVVPMPMAYVGIDDLRYQLEVNVTGQIAVTQAMLPLLRKAKGHIIMMSSVSGRFASPMFGPYAASKFALEAASDALRVELKPMGVKVSIIEPGAVKTPIWDKGTKTTEDTLADANEQMKADYGRSIKRAMNYTKQTEAQAIETIKVAEIVEKILVSQNPKARYLLGRDALQLVFLTLLPTRLRDRIVGGIFGLR